VNGVLLSTGQDRTATLGSRRSTALPIGSDDAASRCRPSGVTAPTDSTTAAAAAFRQHLPVMS